ncbi:MAG TPA: helix-turn-helix transcriptional regulator [Fusibacter sp.]|nr:helix-turn-helix transcriptional regulator [Fusibacter sp.]
MSLKDLRTKKKLTQKQVSQKLEWTQAEYSQLENGKRGIEAKKAKQLADTLGVKLDELIKHL